jgi:hypothetical protein
MDSTSATTVVASQGPGNASTGEYASDGACLPYSLNIIVKISATLGWLESNDEDVGGFGVFRDPLRFLYRTGILGPFVATCILQLVVEPQSLMILKFADAFVFLTFGVFAIAFRLAAGRCYRHKDLFALLLKKASVDYKFCQTTMERMNGSQPVNGRIGDKNLFVVTGDYLSSSFTTEELLAAIGKKGEDSAAAITEIGMNSKDMDNFDFFGSISPIVMFTFVLIMVVGLIFLILGLADSSPAMTCLGVFFITSFGGDGLYTIFYGLAWLKLTRMNIRFWCYQVMAAVEEVGNMRLPSEEGSVVIERKLDALHDMMALPLTFLNQQLSLPITYLLLALVLAEIAVALYIIGEFQRDNGDSVDTAADAIFLVLLFLFIVYSLFVCGQVSEQFILARENFRRPKFVISLRRIFGQDSDTSDHLMQAYVLCYYCLPSFLVCDVSLSLLVTYCSLCASLT